jgi:formate hydrogenlyase subunit 4
VFCHLVFMAFTGFLFFEGSDILLIIFVLTLSAVFLVLAAYASGSPFSYIGAERELILMTAYEPMVLMTLVGIYKVTQSFRLTDIMASPRPLILFLPGIFIGFIYILTMKLRKSPFDISYSHHAHQELVKGITSDLSGQAIAMVEISHWYESIFLLGFIYLFFAFNPLIGIVAVAAVYFLEILIDNTFARYRWERAFSSAWIVALVLGGGNLAVLYLTMGG